MPMPLLLPATTTHCRYARDRGKHDIGFGSEHLLLRNNQRVVAIPYSDIQHVAVGAHVQQAREPAQGLHTAHCPNT
jgi:hypothetical protein